MIATKEKIESRNVKENFTALLVRKEQENSISFDKRFCNNYYEDDLKNLSLTSSSFKSAESEENIPYMYLSIIAMILMGGMGLSLDPVFLILSLASAPIAFIGDTKWSKNRFFKKWIKNKVNVESLKSSYFKQSVADKETLKEFALVYGEDVLVNLLEEREVVKYEDIINSMSNQENNKSKTEKRENLIKAVRCMTNE